MRKTVTLLLLGYLAAAHLAAQGTGDYLNFESPPVKPVAVTEVGGRNYALVVNAPNNSLDVFEITDAAVPALIPVASVPTGLEPISVAVKPTLVNGARIVYTANWLGDSLTRIELLPQPGGVAARLERTVFVGDEPMHLTFMPALPAPYDQLTGPGGQFHEHLLVVFGQLGFWGWFDPATLLPTVAMVELLDAGGQQAVQAGQTIAFTPPTANPASNLPNWLVVLNRRGGQAPGTARGSTDGVNYDFDLWLSGDPFASAVNGRASLGPVGGFGTTNLNLAVAANGDVFVVGLAARNLDVGVNSGQGGEATHLAQVTNGTGFAPSMLWRLRAFATPPIDALDLNAGGGIPFNQMVTQPTDVVVYEPPTGGGPLRVLVAGSSSDAIADVTPAAGPPAAWAVQRIDVAAPGAFDSSNFTGVMRGPRGLAIRYSPTSRANDVVVIYNFIEHSLTTVALNAGPAVSAAVPLADPRPPYVTANRKFLYSSRLSATNTASCASCHIDGHTDQLDWNLSGPHQVDANFPLPGALIPLAPAVNPGEKGPMVTQSLRGLVNSELRDQLLQDLLLSNAPYHWRGDRGIFDHFNGAFVGLLGIPNPFALQPHPLLDQGIPPGPPGLHTMQGFREMVNSIHYPPNPEQPKDRRYSGVLGDPNNPNAGTLAQRGLKLFHIKDYSVEPPPPDQTPPPPPAPVITCVTCHVLPEGSDNLLTDAFAFTDPLNPTAPSPLPVQFLETTAVRGLIEKEKRLFRRDPNSLALVPSGPSTVITGSVGLIHTGANTVGNGVGSESVRAFVNAFSAANTAQDPNFYTAGDVEPVTLYMREFDVGVAPAVGLAVTLTAQSSATDIANSFNIGESSVSEANAGLVVQAEIGGVLFGFYYDPSVAAAARYVEVPPDPAVPSNPAPFGDQTRAQLTGLLTGTNRLVLQCVPLGSERRVAYVHAGRMPPPVALTPGLPALRPMRPNTANQPIPQMTLNWAQLVATINAPGNPSPHRAMAIFQAALITDASTATPPFFGAASTLRHDAPRRLRVAGSNIEHGAHLRLYFPGPNDFSPAPPPGTPPTTTPTTSSHFFVEVPIYPGRDATGVVWESAVELDPQHYYGLLTGATSDTNALNWMLTPATVPVSYTPGTLNPILRNWYFVEIVNAPNSGSPRVSRGSWQRLTI